MTSSTCTRGSSSVAPSSPTNSAPPVPVVLRVSPIAHFAVGFFALGLLASVLAGPAWVALLLVIQLTWALLRVSGVDVPVGAQGDPEALGEQVAPDNWTFVIILALFALLIWRCMRILTISKNLYGALIAGGITVMLLWQIFVNVGVALGAPLSYTSSQEVRADIADQLMNKWARLNPGEEVDVPADMTRLTLDTPEATRASRMTGSRVAATALFVFILTANAMGMIPVFDAIGLLNHWVFHASEESFLGSLVWLGLLNTEFGFINNVFLGSADIPWLTDPVLAKVSVVGIGMRSHAGVAAGPGMVR